MKVEKLDRLCLGVPELEKFKSFMEKTFDLSFQFVGEVNLPGDNVAKIALSDQGIELLETPGKDVHIRSFHFKVDDLTDINQWAKEKKVNLLDEFSVGKMDEAVLDISGLRVIMIDYPGTSPAEAAKL